MGFELKRELEREKRKEARAGKRDQAALRGGNLGGGISWPAGFCYIFYAYFLTAIYSPPLRERGFLAAVGFFFVVIFGP